MRSFLSVPLSVDDTLAGALNLYSSGDHGFTGLDAAAESALHASAQVSALQGTVDGVVRAMETRSAIEQCKGMTALMLGVSTDKAFDLLIWRSRETNVPVRALCRQVLLEVEGAALVDRSSADRLGTILMTSHTRVREAA